MPSDADRARKAIEAALAASLAVPDKTRIV